MASAHSTDALLKEAASLLNRTAEEMGRSDHSRKCMPRFHQLGLDFELVDPDGNRLAFGEPTVR